MKLFLLEQNDNCGYDTYDSCVVCAENEELAKKISPCGLNDNFTGYGSWANSPENVKAIYIGEAADSVKPGLVISSFNAG